MLTLTSSGVVIDKVEQLQIWIQVLKRKIKLQLNILTTYLIDNELSPAHHTADAAGGTTFGGSLVWMLTYPPAALAHILLELHGTALTH